MPTIYQPTMQNGGNQEQEAQSTQSDGRTYEQLKRECLQNKKLFCDPDFPATESSLFYSQKPPIPFEWKRPGEFQKEPKFIVGGATRTDICQGDLGDCWLLAAIASLTLNEKTLTRVVPPDQSFDVDYAGIFHFQFWQHNEWVDVIIDDRLPTFRNRLVFVHSAEMNEFWSALLEKAYAKLNGSYEALKGGSTLEAMEDFTGGVGEMYETKNAPANLFQIIDKALKRGSMLGCSIDITSSAESEAQTASGLVKGHAYSITGLEEVNYRGRKVKLIRVRNPWGQVEWNGPWSDNSSEWKMIDAQERKRLTQVSLDDGEFWMEFEDFKANYDKIEICNLTADSLDDDTPHKWEVTVFNGSWIRGSTAGGCRNYIDTFWTNPQFKVSLLEKDDDHDQSTFIIALLQKNRRKLRKLGQDLQTVGFAIYEASKHEDHLTKDFFRYNPSKARSNTYINLRELSQRFRLPPGDYIVVPTTFEPHKEADFLLRIFSEKKTESLEMGNTISADLPEPPPPPSMKQETEEEKGLKRLFQQISGQKMAISARDLQNVLDGVLSRRKEIKYKGLPLHTCHSIIDLMDTNNTGQIEFPEFIVFWEKVKRWIGLFLMFDTDRSGTMSSYEMRLALKEAGMQLNNKIIQLIGLRFADEAYQITFDEYLACIVRLENMFRVFQALDKRQTGEISLNMAQFLALTMNA
ncbi:CAN9 protein, partial [Polypterus senegalus]|nr:calpain-9 [Polypterus senegalus]MBN3292333.1 CAN9 protein [Polypterus senegalus]